MNAGTSTSQVSPSASRAQLLLRWSVSGKENRAAAVASLRVFARFDQRCRRPDWDCNGAARRGLGITGNTAGPTRDGSAPQDRCVFETLTPTRKLLLLLIVLLLHQQVWRFRLAQCRPPPSIIVALQLLISVSTVFSY